MIRFTLHQNVVAGALLLSLMLGKPVWGQPSAVATENRWETEFKAMEKRDLATPPPKQANLFVGSSTIRLWNLKESFGETPCVNRGFGGSKMAEMPGIIDRLIVPHRPKVLFLYNGDNDIAAGRKAEQVRDDFVTFITEVHEKLPEMKLVWISIKPSPKRWHLREEAQKANRLMREAIAAEKLPVTAVDIWQVMLGDDGLPQKEFYVKDELHMTPAGYATWEPLIKPHLVTADKK